MNEPQPNSEKRGPETAIQAGAPMPAAPVPTEAIVYRPISGWAIASLASGGLFAVLVAVSAAVALFKGAPLFFPMWVLAIPAAGIALAWISERQIRNSEGTRAGAPLARSGFWLSIVSGLIYAAYFFVTGYAVQSQADAFLREPGEASGFFPLLLEGSNDPSKLNAAFLLTMPAASRGGRPDSDLSMRMNYDISPGDGMPGSLTQFREGLFGSIFYKGLAKDAQIIPLEVRNWKYEMNSYKVHRKYRIKTKEIELDMVFSVTSNEAEAAGQGRKWFVNLRDPSVGIVVLSRKYTPLGEGLIQLRGLAREWLEKRATALYEGDSIPDIEQADRTNWSQLPMDEAKRSERRAMLHHAFAGKGKNRFSQFTVTTKPDDPGKWEQVDGKLRFNLAFRMVMPKEAGSMMPGYTIDGTAMIESRTAINPEQFSLSSPPPQWTLISFVVVGVTSMERPKGTPGPGGP